jgi:hypothetical protein
MQQFVQRRRLSFDARPPSDCGRSAILSALRERLEVVNVFAVSTAKKILEEREQIAQRSSLKPPALMPVLIET